ncbi:MAG: methionyl-tRNA formyltransferase [Acidobacteria bacterium]|nr:methionyl-tRNA formyltransferase [Acidobacteriota bacterium]
MSAPRRLSRIAFFGTPEFAVPALDALEAAGRRPILVVSQPPRRAGRGGRVAQPPVARWALERGVDLLQPKGVRGDDFLGRLRDLVLDLAVVAAYGRIFPRSLLELPAGGCVNIHASLLPAWRGAAPIQAAIAAGQKETGVTTMVMEEGLDSGPILLQEATRIGPEETAGELSPRLAAMGARLIVSTLEALQAGTVEPRPQCDEAATYAPMLRSKDGIVDWSRQSREVAWRVRAYEPWPGSRSWLRGEAVRIARSRPLASCAGAEGRTGLDRPGTFLGCRRVEGFGRAPVVRCGGSSALALLRVQRPGGRRISGLDLVNGLRLAVGERFGTAE